MSSQAVVSAMQKWVADVVVGHNFCPFAKKEVINNTIRYVISDSNEVSQGISHCLEEIHHLETHPETETTLLVFPQGFESFDTYLELLDLSTSLLEQAGYAGLFQLASFHPDYCFADADEDDPANYTNRAPYPCLHLLREQSLSRATDKYPEPERIPENNITLARELGKDTLAQQLKNCLTKSAED